MSMTNDGRKRRSSSRIASNKRRKLGVHRVSTWEHDIADTDVTDSDVSRRYPTRCSRYGSTTSSTSLNSDDDFLGLRDFLSNSKEIGDMGDFTHIAGLEALITPASEAQTRSGSASCDLASMHVGNMSDVPHIQGHGIVANTISLPTAMHQGRIPILPFESLPHHEQFSNPSLLESQHAQATSVRTAVSSTKLPVYNFLTQAQSAGPEPLSQDEIFMQLLSNDTVDIRETPAPRSKPRDTLLHKLPEPGQSLLTIKLRPVTRGKSRALNVKEIPPLYVPILPAALAWCLVEDANPDSEDDSPVTDSIALRTAKHLTGLRVLKRDVNRIHEQEEAKGRLVSQYADDELLKEYLAAVMKPRSTKKVTFDDTAAQIVLADWKGISVDDL